MYILGVITGIGIAGLIFVILAFFRAGIEKRIKIIETQLGRAGPQPKGAIFLPDEDSEIARQELIKENNKAGRDTPLEDLRNL